MAVVPFIFGYLTRLRVLFRDCKAAGGVVKQVVGNAVINLRNKAPGDASFGKAPRDICLKSTAYLKDVPGSVGKGVRDILSVLYFGLYHNIGHSVSKVKAAFNDRVKTCVFELCVKGRTPGLHLVRIRAHGKAHHSGHCSKGVLEITRETGGRRIPDVVHR